MSSHSMVYVRSVFLNDGDILSISESGIQSHKPGEEPPFEILEGTWEEEDKGVFEHLMLKEIHDQPISVSNVLGENQF